MSEIMIEANESNDASIQGEVFQNMSGVNLVKLPDILNFEMECYSG